MAYDVGVLEEPSFTSDACMRELGESDLDQVSGGGCLLIVIAVAVVIAAAAAHQQGREDGYNDTKCS